MMDDMDDDAVQLRDGWRWRPRDGSDLYHVLAAV